MTIPAASLHEIAIRDFEREVELLRRENPEMDEDTRLFADMVEGSTSLEDLEERFLHAWVICARNIRYSQECVDKWKAIAEPWHRRIERVRRIGHITGNQKFTIGTETGAVALTVYDQRAPAEVLYNKDTLPGEFWKVNEPLLRKALAAGEKIPDAKLVNSNLEPSMRIRIK